MKTLTLTICLIIVTYLGYGQIRIDNGDFKDNMPVYNLKTGHLEYNYQITSINDAVIKEGTTAVIAFCIDTSTLKTTFRKMYGISSFEKGAVFINGIIIYKEYLMPDRKTKSIYRVVYSIEK